MAFKKDFVWGAATASYQVEGAYAEDGKGKNIWDEFTHTEGKITDKSTGDVACDHYHKYKEDVQMMADLGLKAYRFSLCWSRIIPDGTGQINQKGIGFYNNLIDELLKYGIEPYVTLYHWDLPYALHLKGGWLNDDSPLWFAEYAKVVKKYFGDRVKHFLTLNEPQVFAGCGYFEGSHAPGYKLAKGELLHIGHNILKAHGLAVKALRDGQKCSIGFASASCPPMPVTESKADIDAARENYFLSDYDAFLFSDAYWADPIVKGQYPDWVRNYKGDGAPVITDEDLKLINQPLDFIGMNIYNGRFVSVNKGVLGNETGYARTLIGWPITPTALYWGPKFFNERYNLPIIITENGMSCHDVISLDGKVHDPNRIDYLHRYLRELKRATDDGVPVEGYFQWSLMDNFEWAQGYNQRFGMVFVDYSNQTRIIKDSGYWYKKLIEENGNNL